MSELLTSTACGPSKRAVVASGVAVAVASGLLGAGGFSGVSGLKVETQKLLHAATHGPVLWPRGAAKMVLPSGSLPTTGAATPFVLKAANSRERERAVRCLSNAVYYEAAREPEEGQRAVAQVVLNRVRDQNFPKSVCGVVYQGWERTTGCQFSFTCDGSLLRAPDVALMSNARRVAEDALAGHVEPQVGTATHYHADYVSPWWKTGVTRVAQIGAHIFYRWPGNAGALAALTGQYRGGELRLSEAALNGRAPRPIQIPAPIDPVLMKLQTLVVADATAPSGVRERIHATMNFGVDPVAAPAMFSGARPQPTREQVQQMNILLEKRLPEHPSAAATAPLPQLAKSIVQAAATPAPKPAAVEEPKPAVEHKPAADAASASVPVATAETTVSGG